jgi:hypothetical protein
MKILSIKNLAVFLVFITSTLSLAASPKVLFYSNTCPHCLEVQKLIKGNSIVSETIVQKEVVSNLKNQHELIEILHKCKVTSNSVDLPVLWTGNVCLIGENDVVNFLQKTYQVR